MRLGTLAFFAALSLPVSPVAAAEAVTDCDRLAASPDDPGRVAPGIDIDAIDGKAADVACHKALKAEPGVSRFHYQLGRALEAEEHYNTAMAAYRTAFEKGYAPAAQAEGRLYELGLGRDVDYGKAAEFYQQAIDAGDVFAASDLGSLHEAGEGFDKSAVVAEPLYRRAAEAGSAAAQVHLGYLYDTGTGVEADAKEAAAWYRKAADQGFDVGQYDLGLMYADGLGVEKSLDEALRLLRLAADQNYGLSILVLARYARDGTGMPVDKTEAEKLFRRAIDTGDEDATWQAENELAWMWARDGKNVDEAAKMAARALQGLNDDGEDRSTVLDTSALIAHLKHEDAKALSLQQAAVKGDSKYAPYHDHLGDWLLAVGRKTEAVEEWQTALRLDPPDPGDEWDRPAVIKKLAAARPADGQGAGGRDSTEATISPIR